MAGRFQFDERGLRIGSIEIHGSRFCPRLPCRRRRNRALMHSVDWSKMAIGPLERWSSRLQMMVSYLLANRFPLLLWWADQYCQIYNDAFQPLMGTSIPSSLVRLTVNAFRKSGVL